ncbi:MAG: MBL fold metallo-hydrolase [Candidatus Hermodarchaeota archaeon]
MSSDPLFEIKIVFDNKCVEEGFLTGFGFSALVYNRSTQDYFLFDTGGNSNILIHNIEKFNVKIQDIKKVMISHNHNDHAGSLKDIYKINPQMEIFVASHDLKSFQNRLPTANVRGIVELTEIEKNIYSSGEIRTQYINEHAVFLKTQNGEIVVLVGCSHPGVEKFITKAKELGRIKAILGGFHDFKKLSFLDDIDFIGACHCTQRYNIIRKKFPEQFKRICVGQTITF